MKLGKSIRYKNADTQSSSSRYPVRFARSSIRAETLPFEIEFYCFKKLMDHTKKGKDNVP